MGVLALSRCYYQFSSRRTDIFSQLAQESEIYLVKLIGIILSKTHVLDMWDLLPIVRDLNLKIGCFFYLFFVHTLILFFLLIHRFGDKSHMDQVKKIKGVCIWKRFELCLTCGVLYFSLMVWCLMCWSLDLVWYI